MGKLEEALKLEEGNLKKTMLTDELDNLDNISLGTQGQSSRALKSLGSGIKHQWNLAKSAPHVVFFSLFIMTVLCGAGLFAVHTVAKEQHDDIRAVAQELAEETGQWFSSQLDQAILPLFSMAQFVSELEIFHDLPDRIGPAFEPYSLPFIDPKSTDPFAPVTHRNVSGVCDDPQVVEKFTHIAANVKRNSKMEGVLVNLQLAPQAVVCLLHPMVNSEDFTDGKVMNNTGAWGHDLLTDPARRFIAEATIPSDDIVIAGPLSLKTCSDCDPTVEKAFIARMPIDMPGHTIVVNDVPYEKWGFAVALINWNALIERSNVYQNFEDRGFEFQLTRTDSAVDTATGEITETVVVLAETPGFANKTDQAKQVTTALDTTNNEWQMTVVYEYEEWGSWRVWAVVSIVLVSFLIGVLCFTVLMQNENLALIKKRYDEDVAQPQKLRLRNFLAQQQSTDEEVDIQKIIHSNPIADLYPNVTILYSDIVGFTSWASEREPSQVFALLQTILCAFDKIAKKYGVLKVDTNGDCFVAVTGILDTHVKDHALRMIKFARECRKSSVELLNLLEITLGPGTGDLSLRFGVCSGPATAGVLVGDGSGRIQLVGSTMIAAAQLEASGLPGRIHISQSTADELFASGMSKKSVQRRKDSVAHLDMQTYWIKSSKNDGKVSSTSKAAGALMHTAVDSENALGDTHPASSICSGSERLDDESEYAFNWNDFGKQNDDAASGKQERLIEWQVNMMTKLLKKIVARRHKHKKSNKKGGTKDFLTEAGSIPPFYEVKEIVTLPAFDPSTAVTVAEIDAVVINPEVISQLRSLISEIAGQYRQNPFHNFEHAIHVSMSVHKMLNRIVSPEDVNYVGKAKNVAAEQHKHTFGITSDPLTHFAIVFSALVHDVDHTGVSNGQRAKEDPDLADKYKNQSLAEQNSVDLAWASLMKPCYQDLRDCLFGDEVEFSRFRQLVVNVVLATDIFDKQLKEIRNRRWNNAFDGDSAESTYAGADISIRSNTMRDLFEQPKDDRESALKLQHTNRKATIVIEHIIQASDVAHTMQDWEVYKKWNEKLFQEMYVAWKAGRLKNDPSIGWYKGEIWFFDNYVIPLGHKLEECGVFGVASDECLHHALQNRKEWIQKGQEIVESMRERCAKSRFLVPEQVLWEGDEGEEQ